jgi:hypothetical protein
MKRNHRILVTLGIVTALVLIVLFLTVPSAGQQQPFIRLSGSEVMAAAAAAAPVVFAHDPNWPTYAQTEITVHPEPPMIGHPTEICVAVQNTSDTAQTVTIDFSVSSFGIGMQFGNVGSQTITVPPQSPGTACVVWIPRQQGHWCIQVILHQTGFGDLTSQRNVDVWEVLQPGVPSEVTVTVRNPLTSTVSVTVDHRVNPRMANWSISQAQMNFGNMSPGQTGVYTFTVTPPVGAKLGTRDYIMDVEATAMVGQTPLLIGGFRKMDWMPVPLHIERDPPYAESEITVEPYPPAAGEPTRICVELTNQSLTARTVDVYFEVTAALGIGLPFHPIAQRTVQIPARSTTRACITWVPPRAGQFCVQIKVSDPQNVYVDQYSQRNLDVNEILLPNLETAFLFPVRNPLNIPTTVNLTAVKLSSFFDLRLEASQLPNMQPNEIRVATLWVKLKPGSLPSDGMPIADVEATCLNGQQVQGLIGGIRKIYRPPVPIHQPADPPYAEREISIQPYPPRAGEPTEICVELRNPTNALQSIHAEFAVANFGIGLPWVPIQAMLVDMPPNSIVKKCVVWVPPYAGHFCAQITLGDPQQRFPEIRSQRNMDVGEVFIRGQSTNPFVFLVGNPGSQTQDIELVPIVRLPGWQATLDQTSLKNVAPQSDLRTVQLTVSVPDQAMPPDDTPVVDVEGYSAGKLIGGFRKLYRPPVPIHRPQDPVYAESEITINPYPPREREPTEICADIRNPTVSAQTVSVTFAVANFGIGLPFHDIVRPISVSLAAQSFKRTCVTWIPPFGGQFCARVTLQMTGHHPVWSQRNMDVSEILIPGKASTLIFPVGNPITSTATVALGLVQHLENWTATLSDDTLADMQAGEVRNVTLTVTPPAGQAMPPDGAPVVDVEGFIDQELIGGFRKIYRPPVPVHKPRDPVYAES